MNDAGTVSVKFTVANAEAVRLALQNLGKDGEKALKQFDSSAKTTNPLLRGLSDVVESIRGRATGLASEAGSVGSVISRWGPVGIAAGAGLGVAAIAISKIIEGTNQLAETAGRMVDFSQTVGLTVEQIQALNIVGRDVGVSEEKLTTGLSRMSASMDDVRRGTGAAFEQIRRINPGLAEQLARTKDLTEAIDVLAEAYSRAGMEERNALSRAFFGKGGYDLGRVLQEISGASGLDKLTAGLSKSINLTGKQAKALDELKDSAERLERSAWEKIMSIGAEGRLRQRKEIAEDLESIAKWLDKISKIEIGKSVSDLLDWVERRLGGSPLPKGGDNGIDPSYPDEGQRARRYPGYAAPKPPLTPELLYNTEQRRLSLLGDAATITEQRIQKERQLAIAVKDGEISQQDANRALAAFSREQSQAIASIRQRLGLASEEEMVQSRLMELQEARAKGAIRSGDDMVAVERQIRKEVHETAQAMEVQRSSTPALTRLAQEAEDVNKQLDQGMAGWARSLSSEFSILNRSTESFGDRLKNLALRLVDVAIQAQIMKTVISPMSKGFSSILSSFFGGGSVASAYGNVFQGGNVIPFASGGVFTSPIAFGLSGGRVGVGAEAGPEALMPLRRDSRGRLGVHAAGAGGGDTFNYNDHRQFNDITPDVMAKLEARLRAERPRIVQEVLSQMKRRRSRDPQMYDPA